MIEARQIGVERDGRCILDGIDLDVDAGSFTVLVGPNGAGKSTLVDVLRGFRRPTRGEVTFDGTSLQSLAPKERAAKVAWLPQHPRVHDVMTVAEWLGTARFRFGEPPRAARPAIERALEAVGLPDAIDRLAHTLSGGEAQRVALAALMAQEATVWLLDEPTHHLDPAAVQAILGLVVDRFRAGQTVLVVVHDLDALAGALSADDRARVAVVGLKAGRVAFRGTLDAPNAIAKALSDLYEIRVKTFDLDGRQHFLVAR